MIKLNYDKINDDCPCVQGPVSFDGADRVGITAFYQMHGKSTYIYISRSHINVAVLKRRYYEFKSRHRARRTSVRRIAVIVFRRNSLVPPQRGFAFIRSANNRVYLHAHCRPRLVPLIIHTARNQCILYEVLGINLIIHFKGSVQGEG